MTAAYDYNQNTVIDLFRDGVKKYGTRTLFKYYSGGTWKEMSWNDTADRVDCLASYLINFGIKPGDILSIYSENRPEWAIGDFATLCVGAVDAAIYPTNSAPEAAYIINDSKSVVCFCSGKFQVDNLLAQKGNCPSLKKIIVSDDIECSDPMVITLGMAIEEGRKNLKKDEIEKRSKAIKGDDVMTVIYSSGTTGEPKGVMLTHKNIMFICLTFNSRQNLPKKFTHLSLLPLSHAVERTMDYYSLLEHGALIAYSRGTDFFADDLKIIRPEASIYVPRVFEKVYNGVMAKVKEAPEKKQKLIMWALETGKAAVPYMMADKRKPLLLALKYAIADKLIFSKLREALGLDRCQCWGAAGAPLAMEIHDFFWAIGIQARKGYGLT